jgi:hypothetical protein
VVKNISFVLAGCREWICLVQQPESEVQQEAKTLFRYNSRQVLELLWRVNQFIEEQQVTFPREKIDQLKTLTSKIQIEAEKVN